jgi:hypothetical protein
MEKTGMNIRIRKARLVEEGILTEVSLRSKQSNGYDDEFMTACPVKGIGGT